MTNTRATLLALILVYGCGLHAGSKTASLATRVAAGDYPLNLLQVEDRYLISTNNGYGPHYLQAYDVTRREVTGKLDLPSLWFGLAFDPARHLLLASDGKNGIYEVPFDRGAFGQARHVEIQNCKFTAGLALVDGATAVVVVTRVGRSFNLTWKADPCARDWMSASSHSPKHCFPKTDWRFPAGDNPL